MHTTKNEKPQDARYAPTHPNTRAAALPRALGLPGAFHSPLTIPDDSELAAELSAVDGLPLAEARTVAAIHLRRMSHGAGPVCTNCGAYGHTAIDCPAPPLPRPPARLVAYDPPTEPEPRPVPGPRPLPPIDPMPLTVNWSDRERCGYCTGPHATADCRLRKPVFVVGATCANCEGAHPTYRCPELWQALRAPGPDTGLALIVELLHCAQRELAELRAAGLHSAANGVIGDALNAVEAWLDPEAALIRAEQLAAGRERVRAVLAERVIINGVEVPF